MSGRSFSHFLSSHGYVAMWRHDSYVMNATSAPTSYVTQTLRKILQIQTGRSQSRVYLFGPKPKCASAARHQNVWMKPCNCWFRLKLLVSNIETTPMISNGSGTALHMIHGRLGIWNQSYPFINFSFLLFCLWGVGREQGQMCELLLTLSQSLQNSAGLVCKMSSPTMSRPWVVQV